MTHRSVIATSSGERLTVEAVASNTMTWPWGLNGPALQTEEDFRRGRRRAYLAARSSRVRIPWRLAKRWML